ncbi:30S ribosome-binding factor RbfA [Acidihalobacter prosperus]|uniref:Ribosome-binding factor A n=1 Tax=Acidihalobacter prosperus TaxID=160660 RepID=A0A1A6C725_9GAMM|nr:30S ribosome-binding factor RbfA [Acidihalobacter prosperus]OBS10362.1 ribosome-binding factor A [Acidihalobacter prosperus]
MPREFSRSLRVGEQIRRELADLLRSEVKDPGMGLVTVGDVELSKDLSHARVYFTVLGDESAATATATALGRASGFLRRELGRRMRLRIVPELQFVFDDSELRGARVDELIEQARRKDRERGSED